MDWITEQDGNRENKGKEFVIFVYPVGTYVCSYTTDGMYVFDILGDYARIRYPR